MQYEWWQMRLAYNGTCVGVLQTLGWKSSRYDADGVKACHVEMLHLEAHRSRQAALWQAATPIPQ